MTRRTARWTAADDFLRRLPYRTGLLGGSGAALFLGIALTSVGLLRPTGTVLEPFFFLLNPVLYILLIVSLLFFSAAAILLLPVDLLYAGLVKRWGIRRVLGRSGLFLLTPVVFVGTMRATDHLQQIGFQGVANRSEQVVAAIRAYHADHGTPPATLQALVPHYVSRVPNTGMPAEPRYFYVSDPDSSRDDAWSLMVHDPFDVLDVDASYILYQPHEGDDRRTRYGDWVYLPRW